MNLYCARFVFQDQRRAWRIYGSTLLIGLLSACGVILAALSTAWLGGVVALAAALLLTFLLRVIHMARFLPAASRHGLAKSLALGAASTVISFLLFLLAAFFAVTWLEAQQLVT